MCFVIRRGYGYNYGCVFDLYYISSFFCMKNKIYLKEFFKKCVIYLKRMV